MVQPSERVPPGFRALVYDEVRKTPAGSVLGYGHVAARIGRPRMGRHVGWALAALGPGSDVPWWRVLRSDGSGALQGDPSRGPVQEALLRAEGVPVERHRVVMRRFQWDDPGCLEGDPLSKGDSP